MHTAMPIIRNIIQMIPSVITKSIVATVIPTIKETKQIIMLKIGNYWMANGDKSIKFSIRKSLDDKSTNNNTNDNANDN